MAKNKPDVETLLRDRLAELEKLKHRRQNKKHCGHKEYSNAEDVKLLTRIEELEDEIKTLKAQATASRST